MFETREERDELSLFFFLLLDVEVVWSFVSELRLDSLNSNDLHSIDPLFSELTEVQPRVVRCCCSSFSSMNSLYSFDVHK